MIRDIREMFLEMLTQVDWMDNDTKAVAREKSILMSEERLAILLIYSMRRSLMRIMKG